MSVIIKAGSYLFESDAGSVAVYAPRDIHAEDLAPAVRGLAEKKGAAWKLTTAGYSNSSRSGVNSRWGTGDSQLPASRAL